MIYPGAITMYYGEEYAEFTSCYDNGDNCGGAGNDNVARTNPIPENKLSTKIDTLSTKIESLATSKNDEANDVVGDVD